MSRYWEAEDDREKRIARALIVQEFGPEDVDALDYIARDKGVAQ